MTILQKTGHNRVFMVGMKTTTISNYPQAYSPKISTGNSERFYSMDALRGFALLLGVVFHAAESFCPGRISWAIVDMNAVWIFDWFQNLSHSFRMELFFLIAGFFAHLVYHKRGARAFLWNRFTRIVLPFFVGWFVLFPVFSTIWFWGASESGRLGEFGIPAEFHSLPAWQLTIGGLMDPNFYKEAFSLLHLWFLHQLLVIYAIVLVARSLSEKVLGQSLYQRLTSSIDRCFKNSLNSNWKWLAYPVLTVPVLMTMTKWGVDTPNDSLIPHLPTTLLYGGFFLFGWLMHRQSKLLKALGSGKRWLVALTIGFVLSWITKFYGNISDFFDPNNALAAYDRTIFHAFYALMMWSFTLGFTGLFVRFANTESASWRYVADSSYWIYLIHHIVVVPAQILFANLDWAAGIKFFLINAICFPILYLSYHCLVRYTWIGKWLNGRKHKRASSPKIAAVTSAYR